MYLRLVGLIIIIFTSLTSAMAEHENQIYYRELQNIFERISRDYVQEPNKQKMTDEAINGMLTSLDPHSSYFTDEDLEDFTNQTKGEFGGIGVEVIFDNGAIKIISPIDDLPAAKAGIQSGDYVIAVNDELVLTIGFNKAIKQMRGEPGTKVKLLVAKEKEPKPVEMELIREIVKIKPIKAHMEEGDVAYVRISVFNENTMIELAKAFQALSIQAKTQVKGIILDLRNNPGGLLDQAVSVSEYFIESGIIVSTKGRKDYDNHVFSASAFAAKAPKVPIAVLINNGSASASEIVAGCLQDHNRAVILGTKSFGKGSVQTFVKVSPRAAIKLTTAKYYTPNGRSIQGEGIEPDILIEPAKVEYVQQKNIVDKRFSEASLKDYIKNDQKTDTEEKAHKNITKENSELYKTDYQFARAYDLICGLILVENKK